jgi:hypothetical protein
LARLLPVVAVVFGAALTAPAAQAEPPLKPTLTGTNPSSPATTLKPLVRGDADGVIISGVGRSAVIGGPGFPGGGPSAASTENGNFVITLYTNKAECETGVNADGTGTAEALEGTGVAVANDVEADAVTTFYATQTDSSDPTHPSACSAGVKYQQVSGPPPAPTFSATSPVSPAEGTSPLLIGAAANSSLVSIYTNSSCAGGPAATGSASQFASTGIEVQVTDGSETTFYATATLAGFVSACSTSTVTYRELPGGEGPPPGGGGENPGSGGETPGGGGQGPDGPKAPDPKGRPPAPTLRTVPGYAANDNTPTVTGKAPSAGQVEIYGSAGCKGPVLADGSASQFTGPGFDIQVANDTVVAFYGVSIDGGGDRSPCSDAPAIYIEDSTAPHTRITSGPAAKTRKRKVTFLFADISGDTAATFFCKLDNRKWSACHAPLKLKGLGHRRHLIRIRAIDAAGNEEQGVAKRRFRVVRGH